MPQVAHVFQTSVNISEGFPSKSFNTSAVVVDMDVRAMGGNFAIGVLPSIIFFSALVEVANHLGLLPMLMRFFASIFCFFCRCTPPEAVSAAANVFVGMTNAPLLIKPFVKVATHSQLMAIMAAGFGTAGASMLPVYISFGAPAVGRCLCFVCCHCLRG